MMQDEIAQHFVWQPAFPPRHRTQNNDASGGLLLQCGNRLGYAIEISIPGTMQQHDIGSDLVGECQHLVVDGAAVGHAGHVGVKRRHARTGGELRDAEGAGFLGLAQAR